MEVIEVDIIGPQPLHRRFQMAADHGVNPVRPHLFGVDMEFGREDDILSEVLDRLADNPLVVADAL